MDKRPHPPGPRLLLTQGELAAWLRIHPRSVKRRINEDPVFAEKCLIDIAPPGASRRTLRFDCAAVSEYLGIAPPETPPAIPKPRRAPTAAAVGS